MIFAEDFATGLPPDLRQAIVEARSHLAQLIEASVGTHARVKDVQERLGLHAKLSWQIWHAAFGEVSALQQLAANERGIAAFSAAVQAQGCEKAELDRFEAVLDDLQIVSSRYATDSQLLDAIFDSASDAKAELRWRKQAFDANSFIFGARAKALIGTAILFPSAIEGKFDMVRINGFRELLCTRDDVRWPISTSIIEKAGVATKPKREPLDPYAQGVPILLKFCTSPLPKLERLQNGETITDLLKPGLIGLTGAVDLMVGEVLRGVGPIYAEGEGERAHFGMGVRTPAETLYYDHIVRRDLWPQVQRELCVYGELRSETAHDETDRLRVKDRLQSLGKGIKKLKIEEFPNYGEMISNSFLRIGQDPDHFVVFRVRMKYPPIPASAMIRHDLPKL